MTTYTLGFLFRNGRMILAKHKRGILIDKYNGYGGKIKEGEEKNKIKSLARETIEESTAIIEEEKCKELGYIDFHFENKNEVHRVFIYRMDEFSGEPKETAEMGPPEEFEFDKIPYDRMMVGNSKFVSLVIEGKKFKGEFYYSENGEELIKSTLLNIPGENREIKMK